MRSSRKEPPGAAATPRNTDSGGQRVSDDFLDETIAFWQPRYGDRQLIREDARQIVENHTGFFRLLAGWDSEAGQPKE
jgi:hypothetical protein